LIWIKVHKGAPDRVGSERAPESLFGRGKRSCSSASISEYSSGKYAHSDPRKDGTMSLGLILVIILVIFLLGGFSGRFGGYGYGYGHGGVGIIGTILIIIVILMLLGRI
jgi:hypothetical protein